MSPPSPANLPPGATSPSVVGNSTRPRFPTSTGFRCSMKTTNSTSPPQRYRSRDERRLGTATVEFAFLAPLLLVVVLGIWELGRMVEVQQIISNAAREGGRQASTSNLTNDQVKTVVRNYMTQAGLSSAAATNATVNVTNLTNSSL